MRVCAHEFPCIFSPHRARFHGMASLAPAVSSMQTAARFACLRGPLVFVLEQLLCIITAPRCACRIACGTDFVYAHRAPNYRLRRFVPPQNCGAHTTQPLGRREATLLGTHRHDSDPLRCGCGCNGAAQTPSAAGAGTFATTTLSQM